jgi:FkbM family methyltransferase
MTHPAGADRLARGWAEGTGIAGSIWRHPANRGRRLRSIGRFLGWQFVKRALKRPVVIDFHDRRLKCYPDSTSTSAALYFSGFPDYWEMKFLQAYLRPGDHFLDIGANTGVYSILASAYIGEAGHIDAFEPFERTARRVEEQAALNGLRNVSVHRFAVCDRDAEVGFGYSGTDATMHLQRPGEGEAGAVRVKGVRLDSFEPYRAYAVGKIDIEGAEPLAFEGARDRLAAANPPVWLLELAGYSRLYGVSSDEVLERLALAGYDCAVFHPGANRLEYTTAPWELGVQNVLAISRQHAAQVGARLASTP